MVCYWSLLRLRRRGTLVRPQQVANPLFQSHEWAGQLGPQSREQPLAFLRFIAAAQQDRILPGGNLTCLQLAHPANPCGCITVVSDGLHAASVCLNLHNDCLLVMFRRQSRRGDQHGLSGLVAIFVLSAARYLADRKAKKREPPLTVPLTATCSNGTTTNLEP
ncbi:hypothetical protein D3C79_713930 [compost metagenome]